MTVPDSNKFLNYLGLERLISNLKTKNDSLYMPIGTSIPSVFYDTIKYSSTEMAADSTHKTFEFDAGQQISLTAGTRKLTIGHSNSGVAAQEYAGTSDVNNLAFGATVTIPKFTADAQGHITAAGTTTFKLPLAPDDKVKQTVDTGTTAYKVLFGTTSSPTSGNAYEAKYSADITATGAGTLNAKYLIAGTNFKITTSGIALTGTAGAADKASTSDSLIATPAMVNAAIADAIAGVTQISYEVVNALPSTGVAGKIYLLADTSSTSQNLYNEYIWLGSSYEKLGRTDVDLSGYWAEDELVAITSAEIDALFTAAS